MKNIRLLWIALALIALDLGLILTGRAGILVILLTLGLVVWGIMRLGRFLFRRSRIIWRLRNRLIVTYVFIGMVPAFLLLLLAFIGGYFVTGQMAAYLVNSALDRRAESLAAPARVLLQTPAAERAAEVAAIGSVLSRGMPGLQITVTGKPELRFPADSRLLPPDPQWKDFTGTILKDGISWSAALIHSGDGVALMMAPVTPAVLEQLVPGIGSLNLLDSQLARRGSLRRNLPQNPVPVEVQGVEVDPNSRNVGVVPPSQSLIDWQITWPGPVRIAEWATPNRVRTTFVVVTTRPSAVLSIVFTSGIDFAQNILIFFVVIAALFAIVELISLLIGVYMTRTITGAVHHLYEGTMKISAGDFTSRIPVKGRDQLADLGWSFNKMTEQLQRLLEVAREKERMQSELAIASEVQKKLFPRAAPEVPTLAMCGVCEPARSVSGDYFDYLRVPGGRVALAIGDVAGKGISAALLMASIQSIMRTQLDESAHSVAKPGTAHMVAQLNRQLYASTSAEKYATFFFGLYNEASREFVYTNAGHLQPLLISGGTWRLLEVTGTVVGAFPALTYGEERITLGPGDLLVCYTDGVSEPENAYGEEFGIDRLADVVMRHQHLEPAEIVTHVMDTVKQWSGAPELPDDMTVVIARGLA